MFDGFYIGDEIDFDVRFECFMAIKWLGSKSISHISIRCNEKRANCDEDTSTVIGINMQHFAIKQI